MINNYSFKKIDQEDLDRMLTLRNQEQVRDASFNKGLILPEVHSEWFSKKQSSSLLALAMEKVFQLRTLLVCGAFMLIKKSLVRLNMEVL